MPPRNFKLIPVIVTSCKLLLTHFKERKFVFGEKYDTTPRCPLNIILVRLASHKDTNPRKIVPTALKAVKKVAGFDIRL